MTSFDDGLVMPGVSVAASVPVSVADSVPVGVPVPVRATSDRNPLRRCVVGVTLVGALTAAVFTQRSTVSGAIQQMGQLSMLTIGVLAVLTVYERWSRADIVRRLLGDSVSLGQAVTIHDVGTAVSKGVPMGGALGTAARWSITRESNVGSAHFATMLIAYGVATSFVSWLLPFAALLVDLTQRRAELADVVILVVIAVIMASTAVFWMLVLRSGRVEAWATRRVDGIWRRLASKMPSLQAHDPSTGVADVRSELCRIMRRPWWLLGRTILAQVCGSVMLLVALRSLGVGDELGITEFFRVIYLAHLVGTFAPTPGGVGVVEAGVTGALAAAGVDVRTALAGVLIYRFLTYVLPIIFGAVLYMVWRMRRRRSTHGSVTWTDPDDIRPVPLLSAA